MFVISYTVCPWQVFQVWSNVCGWGQEPTLEWNTWRFFTRVGSDLTRKHLTRLEMLTTDKLSSLLQTFLNYERKNFVALVPAYYAKE